MELAKKASGSVVKALAIPRGFIFLIKTPKDVEKGIEFSWEKLGKLFYIAEYSVSTLTEERLMSMKHLLAF